jgi:hypothetical protein
MNEIGKRYIGLDVQSDLETLQFTEKQLVHLTDTIIGRFF